MTCVVVDTNVLISAMVFGGVPDELLTFAHQQGFDLVTSADLETELEGVLADKFGWNRRDIRVAIDRWKSISRRVQPTERLAVITEDPDDNRVLECAAECHADFIVTGDRHLLKLGRFRNTRIVTAREFLDEATAQS